MLLEVCKFMRLQGQLPAGVLHDVFDALAGYLSVALSVANIAGLEEEKGRSPSLASASRGRREIRK
jgi:hypothetical protein